MATSTPVPPSVQSKTGATTHVEHAVPKLHLRLGIDPALPDSQDDKFTLKSSDGKYNKTLTVKDDLVEGDEFVDLVFDNLKVSQKYTLEVDPGAEGSPYKLLEDLPFQEIIDYYSLPEEGDTLGEHEQQQAQSSSQSQGKQEKDWDDDGTGTQEFGGDPDANDTQMSDIVENEEPEKDPEDAEIDWNTYDPSRPQTSAGSSSSSQPSNPS
jgi:hypothetical protein